MADGQTQTPTMTPPPDPTEANLKRTTGDKIGGFLGAISKPGSALGTISDAFERAHQNRLAKAKMYHDVMAEKLGRPAYTDEKDPEHQATVDAYNAAEKEYLKLAPDPETKKNMQMRSAIAKHHVGQTAQGQPGQMTPPPAPQGPQPSAGPTIPATTGTASAVPPPPAAPSMGRITAGIPGEMQRDADARALKFGRQEAEEKSSEALKANQATFDQRKKQATDLNLKPDSTEYQEFVATGKFPTTSKPTAMSRGVSGTDLVKQGITMVDGSALDPKKMYDVFQNSDGTQFAMPSGISSTSAAARLAGTTGSGLMAVVARANQGDKNAQADLKTYMDMQNTLARSRGMGYGAGRAMYQIGAYVDGDTGEVIPMSNYDAIQAIRSGRNLTPSGRLPASMIAGAQRLVKESVPAIKEVRDNLGAYDNDQDRAIFARVMTSAGKPAYGDESHWLGNILNQAATENLSPEGKKLVVRLARLNETIGTLRSTLGAPATDRSMALMLGLLPGPATPDSGMAGDMINQLEQNVTNAVEIPALTHVAKPNTPMTPPPAPPQQNANDPLGIL